MTELRRKMLENSSCETTRPIYSVHISVVWPTFGRLSRSTASGRSMARLRLASKRPVLPAVCRPMVLDAGWIKAHAFHCGPCAAIVRGSHRIIEEKFGPPLRRIDLDRESVAGRITIRSARSSATTNDPSSMPMRRRSFAGSIMVPR
jgi:hypothetical protein